MTLIIIGELAIRTQAIAGMLAPERTIVAVRDGRVPHGFDVQTFPAEITATILTDTRRSGAFAEIGIHYAALPAANNARFTATCVSFTLYPLSLSGLAPAVACLPASSAVAALNVLPAND